MKKFTIPLFALLLLGAMACKKSGASLSGNVSLSEAADILAGSLSSNSYGFINLSDDATVRSQAEFDAKLTCGATRSDTITKSSPAGAATSYSYSLGYSYTLNCNTSNLADNVTGKINYSGTFNNPHVSSSNKGNGSFTLAGLTPTATAYVFNGSVLRSGSFASKADTTNHGSINIDLEVHNLMLHKPGREIASGTATFVLTGNVPKKGNFAFTGNVTFNGDGTATLKVNGTNYSINLTTGEKSKI